MSTTSTRSFEFVGGTSRKFWEIAQAGTDVTVRFGRLGTAGQSHTKTFADATAAAEHVKRLIASKIKKGYAETTGN